MGASAYPLICYNFPTWFFFKIDKSKWYKPEKLFCHFLNIFMILLGIYCTYLFFADNVDYCAQKAAGLVFDAY